MLPITVSDLVRRYDALLIDAYGVLVDAQGRLPHADAFIDGLNARRCNYFILTNDASRLPGTIAARFNTLGLHIEERRIITSGSLLAPYFAAEGLGGARCIVLGNQQAEAYVERAGAAVVACDQDAEAEVIVIADDCGLQSLPHLEAVLTYAIKRLDAGRPLRFVLCNPDVIYPRGGGAWGLTSGSVALILEAALATRFFGAACPRCVGLGKPHAPIFEAALAATQTRNMVLLGDQLATDIRGAKAFGIDSVLVGTGVTRVEPGVVLDPEPTYYLPQVGAV